MFVITGLDIGGAELQVASLAECLRKRQYDIDVVSLTTPLALTERFTNAGITVHSLQMRSALDFPFALLHLLRLIRALRPDVVHGHMVHANILVRVAKIFMPKIKIISTAHNVHEGGWLRDLAYRLTNKFSEINTTISFAATQRFVSDHVFPESKTVTVFNGIDIEKFHLPPHPRKLEGDFTWLAVGRLEPQKDYPTLLNAFAQLPKSRLLIAGKGSLCDHLQQLTETLGIADRVQFLGVRNDVEQLYHQADAFVLASEYEGYGLVIAEAMASGLPVVVTDSGGPSELVGTDGVAGYVVPIKNHKNLASAMQNMMSLSDYERELMGRKGRTRIVELFSLPKIVSKWEELYLSLT